MKYLLCRHIKNNGLQCESPALTEKLYCFFHQRLYARHSPFRHAPAAGKPPVPGDQIQLEPLEDAQSVQVAISVVVNALATGQLESRRATALLYGLSLASANTRRLPMVSAYAGKVVRAVDQTPEGIDLAKPGASGGF